MKYISLLPALFCFLCVSRIVFAADIKINLLDKTDYYTFTVDISGLEKTSCKDKTCYLQGMFTFKDSAPKYFGYTFGQNNWFTYESSPEKDFIKSNFVPFDTTPDGSWSGVVRLQPDLTHPGFKGDGQYLVKIKRYTGESTSPATDNINEVFVDMTGPQQVFTPTPTQTPSSQPTNTPTPSNTPTAVPTSTPTPPKTPTPTKNSLPSISPSLVVTPKLEVTLSPEILGDSTSSPEIVLDTIDEPPSTVSPSLVIQEKNSQVSSKIFLFAGLLFVAVTVITLYMRFRRVKI